MLEPGIGLVEPREHELPAVAVLDVGSMHDHAQHEPLGIDQQMAFPALHLLAAVVAPQPPFSVVLTD